MKREITESTFKKRIIAFTIGAVLLMVFLVSYLSFQLLSINNGNKKKKEYLQATAEYEEMTLEAKKSLEGRKLRWWIERRARELGYHYEGDVDLG